MRYDGAMRADADADKIRRFLAALGQRCRTEGVVYLTGGATALLLGWRDSTVDIDLKLDPEPDGAFEAIARLKDELDVNVELASPDAFLPELRDWRERSLVEGRFGKVRVLHYDLRAQALAKIARGHARDLTDVDAMIERDLVTRAELAAAFAEMRPRLVRYPRLDAERFAARVARVTGAAANDD